MRNKIYIFILLSLLTLTGCGVKKNVPVAAVPSWHTCVVQGCRATVDKDGDMLSATITMQTVRDSMIVVSVMPLLGMEMLRLEVTPLELTAIDKMNGRYAKATFADINRKLTPGLNWDIMQQICTAELPIGDRMANMSFTFGDETISLILEYGTRKTDVPVRMNNTRLTNYTQIDISKWL